MTLLLASTLLMLSIGPPFYWGTLGHGLSVPVLWALLLAVVVGLRTHWRPFGKRGVLLLIVATLVSFALCLSLYGLGRLFSQPV